MTSFYLRPEEDKCILVKMSTRSFSPFLAGIEEPFTKTGVCGWQQEVTQTVPFRSSGGNGVHSVVSFQDFYFHFAFCTL